MNSENFAYWLQGALELGGLKTLNEVQVKVVQDHLDLVFKKVTPVRQITSTPPATTYPVPRLGDISNDFFKNNPPALIC